MKIIQVYQSEFDKEIPLEYVGKVKYIGPDDPLSFVNNGEYNIVFDETEEDYVYILNEPNKLGGEFFYIDDPRGILKKYMKEYKD
ncbi:hypothetical protein [Peptoniphilus senegalensis]|uniref:Uncharacterized protein n=1 Tax=Peptoniphilus senegalensis TaxID=1465757 RepID=A0ABV1J2X7_9FIRM